MVDKLNSSDIFVGGLENLDGGPARSTEAISAGDVVALNGTLTGTVPDVKVSDTAGEACFGVAVHAAGSAGEAVTIAQTGAEVKVNATGTINPGATLISAGTGAVKANDTAGAEQVGFAQTNQVGGDVVMEVTLSGTTGAN